MKIFLSAMETAQTYEFVPMALSTLGANVSRALPIGRMIVAEMLETTRWSLFWPCVALAFGCLAFRAVDRRWLLLLIAVVAPVTVYAATFLFSAWPDYVMHFEASFSRLLLHVMPVAWLAIALILPWRGLQAESSARSEDPRVFGGNLPGH